MIFLPVLIIAAFLCLLLTGFQTLFYGIRLLLLLLRMTVLSVEWLWLNFTMLAINAWAFGARCFQKEERE